MAQKKVQVCFYLDERILRYLDEHVLAWPESRNKLIERVLSGYFAANGTKKADGSGETDYRLNKKKVCMLTEKMRCQIREHKLYTGESGSALLRRLLVAYFAEHI